METLMWKAAAVGLTGESNTNTADGYAATLFLTFPLEVLA